MAALVDVQQKSATARQLLTQNENELSTSNYVARIDRNTTTTKMNTPPTLK
jgi:hypothetical protein